MTTDTTAWRDSIAGSYFPRIKSTETPSQIDTATEVSIIPCRGYIAIYNDYERNKELDPEVIEFNTDNVSMDETTYYAPKLQPTIFDNISANNCSLKYRGKKRNNYYTNYRINLVGDKTTQYPDTTNANTQTLQSHTEWQKTIAEMRQNAENAQVS